MPSNKKFISRDKLQSAAYLTASNNKLFLVIRDNTEDRENRDNWDEKETTTILEYHLFSAVSAVSAISVVFAVS